MYVFYIHMNDAFVTLNSVRNCFILVCNIPVIGQGKPVGEVGARSVGGTQGDSKGVKCHKSMHVSLLYKTGTYLRDSELPSRGKTRYSKGHKKRKTSCSVQSSTWWCWNYWNVRACGVRLKIH